MPTPDPPNPSRGARPWGLLFTLAALLVAAGAGFALIRAGRPGVPTTTASLARPPAAPAAVAEALAAEPEAPVTRVASAFAVYREPAVSVKPAVPPYTVKPDLSNLVNRKDVTLPGPARALLAKNGFVVVPGEWLEFFSLYETNRYDQYPSFVTVDSMLHHYHLFFAHLLRRLEKEVLASELAKLVAAMAEASAEQLEAKQGSDWEQAAERNVAFFAVASRLLDAKAPVPAAVAERVEAELKRIAAHQGIARSEILDAEEDYSQYVPRGHYDRAPALQRYFRAMMWLGRRTFRLKVEDETRSALLMTLALSDPARGDRWKKIAEPIDFFVGRADDLSFPQYAAILARVYGGGAALQDLDDAAKFTRFVEEARALPAPALNSIPIPNAQHRPDREAETRGFRFMGQRFTLDAAVFQRLVYREVGNKNGEMAPAGARMLPKALDIPAALGSSLAYRLLEEAGETKYARYPENMASVRQYLAGLRPEAWTENLYGGWLHALRPLLEEKPHGYPSPMRTEAWRRRELATFLGSWTELKHDTVLSAKQVYAEMGGGPEEEKDDRGYVEPVPELYARLAGLLRMTREGLEARGLLKPEPKKLLGELETLALGFRTMAEKELKNQPLSQQEYMTIREYGGQLEHFWIEALRDEGVKDTSQLDEHPAALVADVATDPNGAVLEEATGWIDEIYVVVPVGGRLRVARGGVFSHYEFTQPLAERLTDAAWRKRLREGKTPARHSWTAPYLARK